MYKIIIDTDIGSDIDDVMALSYLLSHDQYEIFGITTVTGDTEGRAKIASALVSHAGMDIPIYPGASEPLRIKQVQKEVPQLKGLGGWKHRDQFPLNMETDFLNDMIMNNPGEVVLLCIGPLTNIAKLFMKYPETASTLKGLYSMSGRFGTGDNFSDKLEWNVMLDPDAAGIVYGTQVKVHCCIGSDITRRMRMESGDVNEHFNRDQYRIIHDFCRVWFEKREFMTFHDPLAAAVIDNPLICKFQDGLIEIDGKSVTYWRPEAEEGHNTVTVDVLENFGK